MKKIKIYSFISLILGLVLTAISIVIPIIMINIYTFNNGSIGIIGGADAPTSWFLSYHILGGRLLPVFAFGNALFLVGLFCLIFDTTVYNNCSVKTTALALMTSIFGALGIMCFLLWFSIVSFHEMSKHPITYPLSIVGGLVSLIVFIISIIFYIKARKTKLQIKGIIIDILTSIIFLPTFFVIFLQIMS